MAASTHRPMCPVRVSKTHFGAEAGVSLCMKQFADPAEVKATSARMRSYKLAQVCPTSGSSRDPYLRSVEVTAVARLCSFTGGWDYTKEERVISQERLKMHSNANSLLCNSLRKSPARSPRNPFAKKNVPFIKECWPFFATLGKMRGWNTSFIEGLPTSLKRPTEGLQAAR